jgi:DNA-binding GntR family transcriptional regulator
VEAELTEAVGASRATVRAALAQLASEGLVENIRNRGARVIKARVLSQAAGYPAPGQPKA